MKRPILILVAFDIAFAFSSSTVARRADAISVSEVVCCTGRFTLDNILREVRLPRPRAGIVQMYVVRERNSEETAYAASSHSPLFYYREIFWREHKKKNGVAYLVQSGKGASAAVWSIGGGGFTEATIWGQEILRLDSGTRIVHIGPGHSAAGGIDPTTVRVWVSTTRSIDKQHAEDVIALLRGQLGIASVQLYCGSQPYYWGTNGFPWLAPSFGTLSESEIDAATAKPFLYCVSPAVGDQTRCW